jgi:hypothetical protein
VEPRFRGSASPVEALCGSTTSSIHGAAVRPPVWQGSAWSRSWSSFWSPAKQGLSFCKKSLRDQQPSCGRPTYPLSRSLESLDTRKWRPAIILLQGQSKVLSSIGGRKRVSGDHSFVLFLQRRDRGQCRLARKRFSNRDQSL